MEKFCKICFEKIDFSFLRNVVEHDINICSSCLDKIKVELSSSIIEGVKVKFLSFYDGILKQSILAYKESRDYELRDIFLYLFIPYIKYYSFNYIFVPIPSTKDNINRRGFNHLEDMLTPYKIKYVNALDNISNDMQKELKQTKRIKNKNIVLNSNAYQLKNKNIILFDDVYTTGSTLISSIKEIKKISPKRIKGLILMRNTYQIT